MDLYLVRHAVAERRNATRWPEDTIRPLTADGAKRFARAARGLRTIVPVVDLVLSSPWARAWQTAQILYDEIGWPAPEPCTALTALRPTGAVLKVLRDSTLSGAVAMVGHEPHLSEFAALLLAGPGAAVHLELEKGGAMCLTCPEEPAPGDAQLRWSVNPNILTALDVNAG